ncbi:MAG: DUF2442 domain-containing protein [Thermodesulfobacteriota bacterium]
MISESLGVSTSEVEVTNISRYGLWLLVGEEELFLPFDEFPWFKNAPLQAILNVKREGPEHLHWPDLDVDLALDSIKHPDRYPLISRVDTRQTVGEEPR